jgi:hypothetical protein
MAMALLGKRHISVLASVLAVLAARQRPRPMSKIRYRCTVRDIETCESDGAVTPILGRITHQHDEMTEQPFARKPPKLNDYSFSV